MDEKNGMDEKNIVADALAKPFFCNSDVPDAKLFCIFLWLRTKKEVM